MVGNYRIVCAELSWSDSPSGHGHVKAIRVGQYLWSVASVRKWMAENGDRFYTVSPTTGKQADVVAYDCECGVRTIRSDPDAVTDNDLEDIEC
jgi:hypothetical protein